MMRLGSGSEKVRATLVQAEQAAEAGRAKPCRDCVHRGLEGRLLTCLEVLEQHLHLCVSFVTFHAAR